MRAWEGLKLGSGLPDPARRKLVWKHNPVPKEYCPGYQITSLWKASFSENTIIIVPLELCNVEFPPKTRDRVRQISLAGKRELMLGLRKEEAMEEPCRYLQPDGGQSQHSFNGQVVRQDFSV